MRMQDKRCHALAAAIEAVGGFSEVAAALGLTQGAVSQWTRCPAVWVLPLIELTALAPALRALGGARLAMQKIDLPPGEIDAWPKILEAAGVRRPRGKPAVREWELRPDLYRRPANAVDRFHQCARAS